MGTLFITDLPIPLPRHHPLNKIPRYAFTSDDFDPRSDKSLAKGWIDDRQRFPHLHAPTLLAALRPVNRYLEGTGTVMVVTFTRTTIPRIKSFTFRGIVVAKSPVIQGRSGGETFVVEVRYGERTAGDVGVDPQVGPGDGQGARAAEKDKEKGKEPLESFGYPFNATSPATSVHPPTPFLAPTYFSTFVVFKLPRLYPLHDLIRVGADYVFTEVAVRQFQGGQMVASWVEGKSRLWPVLGDEVVVPVATTTETANAMTNHVNSRATTLLSDVTTNVRQWAKPPHDCTTGTPSMISYSGTVSNIPSDILITPLVLLDGEVQLHFHRIAVARDLCAGSSVECHNVHLTRTIDGKSILVACSRSTIEVVVKAPHPSGGSVSSLTPSDTAHVVVPSYPVPVAIASWSSALDAIHLHIIHSDLRRKGLIRLIPRNLVYGSGDPNHPSLLAALATRWRYAEIVDVPCADVFTTFLNHSECCAARRGFEVRRFPTLNELSRHPAVLAMRESEEYALAVLAPADVGMDRAVLGGKIQASSRGHFELADITGRIPLVVQRSEGVPINGSLDPSMIGGLWMVEQWELVVERVANGLITMWVRCKEEDLVCLVERGGLLESAEVKSDGCVEDSKNGADVSKSDAPANTFVDIIVKFTFVSAPRLHLLSDGQTTFAASCEGIVREDSTTNTGSIDEADRIPVASAPVFAHLIFRGDAVAWLAYLETGRCYRIHRVIMEEQLRETGEFVVEVGKKSRVEIVSRNGFESRGLINPEDGGQNLPDMSDDTMSIMTQEDRLWMDNASSANGSIAAGPTCDSSKNNSGIKVDLLGRIVFDPVTQSTSSPALTRVQMVYSAHAPYLSDVCEVLNSNDAHSFKGTQHGYLERLASFEGVIVSKEFRDREGGGVWWMRNLESGTSKPNIARPVELFHEFAVGTGRVGKVLYLKIRDLVGIDVVDFYWDLSVHVWPLGVIPGAIIRVWNSARKASKGGRSIYCASLACTAVEVCGNVSSTDGAGFSVRNRLPNELDIASLSRAPRFCLCELLEVELLHLRTTLQVSCRIIALAEVTLRFQCDVCGTRYRDQRCGNSCGSDRGHFSAEARAVVEDGTGEAHVYFEGPRAVFELLRTGAILETSLQEVTSRKGEISYRNVDFYSIAEDQEDIYSAALSSQDEAADDDVLRAICRDDHIFRDVVVYGKRYRREGDEKYPERTVKLSSGDAPLETFSLPRLVIKATRVEDINISTCISRELAYYETEFKF
ncbi:CST complex subunit ctc1 [Gonapodya sp. JEL0774]|nr:CST complex subunit ctc1 [Gonapodya sp. JEL0774]